MSNRSLKILKVLAHVACAAPLAWLLWHLYESLTSNPNALGPDPTHTVTFFTGFGALRLLILSLAISPVRRIFTRLAWLIRFRRMVGLWAFAYASLHLLTYLWLYAGWNLAAMEDDVARRPYIWAGLTAWTLLLPLAATSTTWSIRKLGGKSWNRLHKLAYASAVAGVVHYWWTVKSGVLTPLTLTVILAVLLALRPVLTWWKARRRPGAMPAAA